MKLEGRRTKRSGANHPSSFTLHPSFRAFTLIEMLVVIGIIAVLAAFLLPAVNRARIRGRATRMAQDLQTISTALEAFKTDTGDYPRSLAPNTGFCSLAKELVGPFGNGLDDALSKPGSPVLDAQDPPVYSGATTYKPGDAVRQSSAIGAQTYVCVKESTGAPTTDLNSWVPYDVNDSKDGPGSAVRAGGPVRGPYLPPDRFRMRGCALLDIDDNPILYFPRGTGHPNVNATFRDASGNTLGAYVDRSRQSAYDADDNLVFFLQGSESITNGGDADRAVKIIRMMLGDYDPSDTGNSASTNGDGKIDPKEHTPVTAPYLLWCAGPDGFYGPRRTGDAGFPTIQVIEKCDDVTNFK